MRTTRVALRGIDNAEMRVIPPLAAVRAGRACGARAHPRRRAGAPRGGRRGLRPYTSLPWSRFAPHPTPGISPDTPTYRRYHGAVIFGTEDRTAVDDLLGSHQVAAL